MSSISTESKHSFVVDSLAVGMLVMLAMTIIQRGVGFFRGIWFCRLLDDAVVGQWSMAYDFITLIYSVGAGVAGLVFCIWVAVATIGQDYLWVAERADSEVPQKTGLR